MTPYCMKDDLPGMPGGAYPRRGWPVIASEGLEDFRGRLPTAQSHAHPIKASRPLQG